MILITIQGMVIAGYVFTTLTAIIMILGIHPGAIMILGMQVHSDGIPGMVEAIMDMDITATMDMDTITTDGAVITIMVDMEAIIHKTAII